MPLFSLQSKGISVLKHSDFKSEKVLQSLIEKNLPATFGARFVATEFSTGARHAGRIDTLAIDENDNPVIIEYKVTESSDLINQSLFYLSWIDDHRADFAQAASRQIGQEIEIDWDKIRVICIAPGFKKYDLHAVEMMGANIELWTYQLYENDLLSLEKVYPKTQSPRDNGQKKAGKSAVMVEAGKKAAETRRTATYSVDKHLSDKTSDIVKIADEVREFILTLSDAIEEAPKKFYIAYKVSQNFVCMEVQKRKLTLFLKLDPKANGKLPPSCRDVSNIGHYGTGDLEMTLTSLSDVAAAKVWIRKAFEKIGG